MIAINSDLGEGLDNEAMLLPYIHSCNIACGGHAGNAALMRKVSKLALKHQVQIGAHPSYPDKRHFGRKTVRMTAEDFVNTIATQVASLDRILTDIGGKLHHIKAHGALYHDLCKEAVLSQHYLRAISPYKETVSLYVPWKSVIETMALQQGFTTVCEAFADRNYHTDLSLVSRRDPQALISDPRLVIKQVLTMVESQQVRCVNGSLVPLKAATFCIHSDTENAPEIARQLYQHFNKDT